MGFLVVRFLAFFWNEAGNTSVSPNDTLGLSVASTVVCLIIITLKHSTREMIHLDNEPAAACRIRVYVREKTFVAKGTKTKSAREGTSEVGGRFVYE